MPALSLRVSFHLTPLYTAFESLWGMFDPYFCDFFCFFGNYASQIWVFLFQKKRRIWKSFLHKRLRQIFLKQSYDPRNNQILDFWPFCESFWYFSKTKTQIWCCGFKEDNEKWKLPCISSHSQSFLHKKILPSENSIFWFLANLNFWLFFKTTLPYLWCCV